jgi:DNA-binding response OmpR family regulator
MKTILAIDDDKSILEVLKDVLSARGYKVLTATSVDEAMSVLRQRRRPDLLLLDLNMPGRNGFALYSELDSSQPIPVLFVSGFSQSFSPSTEGFTNIWTNGFTLGMTDILYKPFAISLLYEKVEALIGDSGLVENEQTHRP